MMRKCGMIWMAIVLAMALSITALAAQAQTLTAISFSNESAVAEENLSISGYGDKESGYATSVSGGRIYASVSGTDLRKLEWSKGEYGERGMQPVMTGGTKNPWGNGAYLEVRVPTTGYENITFSASLGGTKKGPRDFKLQVSTDGVTYTDVAGAVFSIAENKTMFRAFNEVALPSLANNAMMLYIRVAVASNIMVNGSAGLVGGTGGETAINDVTVSGTPIATTAPVTTTTASGEDAEVTTATTTTTAATDVTTSTSVSETNATTTTVTAPSATAASGVNTADVSKADIAWVGMLVAAAVLLAATNLMTRRYGEK